MRTQRQLYPDLAKVYTCEYETERERVRSHRKRVQFHTRSVKLAQKQLAALKKRWLNLPPESLSV